MVRLFDCCGMLLVLCLLTHGVTAQEGEHPPHYIFELGDFVLESGATIPDAKMLFATHGALNGDRSNAVLLPSFFLGNHHGYDHLIGPDRALDPEENFIIVAEMFGSGGSSSPSNGALAANDFPPVSIRDNVRGMYRLVTEEFGINRLQAVIGHSMGAQQAFQWAVSYPDFVDVIVPIAGTARTHPHGVVRMESALTLISGDPALFAGADTLSTAGKTAWTYHWMAWLYSPQWWREERFRTEATPTIEAFLDQQVRYGPTDRPYDYLTQGRAWQNHDVGQTPGFEGDLETALESIRAKVIYMPGETDMYFPVTDAEYESRFIPDVELYPIPSIWGHAAGGGPSAGERQFIAEQIRRALRGHDP